MTFLGVDYKVPLVYIYLHVMCIWQLISTWYDLLFAWYCLVTILYVRIYNNISNTVFVDMQEIVEGGMVKSCKGGSDMILPVLVSILETPNYSDETSNITSCLTRTYKALSALSDIHIFQFHTYIVLSCHVVHAHTCTSTCMHVCKCTYMYMYMYM